MDDKKHAISPGIFM